MDRVYKKIKGKTIKYDGYSGIVCGASDGKYIAATEEKPKCSFRRLDKKTDSWVEEEFKDIKYRYFYCNEWDIYMQNKRMKKL
jgi:hypothetical protein